MKRVQRPLPVTEKALPCSLDAERFVLGSVLMEPSRLAHVSLQADDFSIEKHRRIWRAITDLANTDVAPDRFAVAQELHRRDELESCDGVSYLVSLDDGMPRIVNLEGFVRIVKEKSALRKIIFTSQHAMNRCFAEEGGASINDETLIADPAAAKALLCERISAGLGVRICRLVKFAGKAPTFSMELEETKIEFLSVRKLMSQSTVREKIAASTGKIIRKFKGKDWDQLAQAMLDACVIEQGGEEKEREGLVRMYVAQYLAETGFLDTLEGQRVQNQRKPIMLNGKVAICASDLQMFVNKTMLQILSVKAVASMLGALGGKSIRVRGQKFKEQGRWVLPLDQFDPAEYSHRKMEEHTSDAI